jgi:NAD(P)-dependent dehydrogenase (short-subunit alcohol dehydrogenase family)
VEKKNIVITGSTRGIGLEMASEFSRLGHQVVVNGRSQEAVSRTVAALSKLNPDVAGVPGSVSQVDTHHKIIRQSMERFGKIDVWINNAGIPQPYKPFGELADSEMKDLIDVNIYGLVTGTRIAMEHMTAQGYGKIFNLEGLGSDGRIMNKLSLYGTTKRAVNYFTRAVAREMKGGPLQIGVLSPGMVRTEFIEAPMESATREEIKRFGKVLDILAEEPDVVARFLVRRMLSSTRNYDRIVFLSKSRLMMKLIRMTFK